MLRGCAVFEQPMSWQSFAEKGKLAAHGHCIGGRAAAVDAQVSLKSLSHGMCAWERLANDLSRCLVNGYDIPV